MLANLLIIMQISNKPWNWRYLEKLLILYVPVCVASHLFKSFPDLLFSLLGLINDFSIDFYTITFKNFHGKVELLQPCSCRELYYVSFKFCNVCKLEIRSRQTICCVDWPLVLHWGFKTKNYNICYFLHLSNDIPSLGFL